MRSFGMDEVYRWSNVRKKGYSDGRTCIYNIKNPHNILVSSILILEKLPGWLMYSKNILLKK